MRRWLITVCLLASAGLSAGETMPLTPKEVSLMLRSGYSSEAIVREISRRHFAGPLDSVSEKQIIQAGATQSLMETLRGNAYQASDTEQAALQERLAKREESAADADTQLKRTETVKNSSPERSTVAPASAPTDAIYSLLKGDLISLHQGGLGHFDDEGLEQKKVYLLFFSANWSPVGRKFTSQLIDYYNRVAPQHPEFELVFFSVDRSQFGMETYMRESNMPWPAVVFDKVPEKLTKFPSGLIREAPFLILTNASGNIISLGGTSDDKNNLSKVLADLDRVLLHPDAKPIVPNR